METNCGGGSVTVSAAETGVVRGDVTRKGEGLGVVILAGVTAGVVLTGMTAGVVTGGA